MKKFTINKHIRYCFTVILWTLIFISIYKGDCNSILSPTYHRISFLLPELNTIKSINNEESDNINVRIERNLDLDYKGRLKTYKKNITIDWEIRGNNETDWKMFSQRETQIGVNVNPKSIIIEYLDDPVQDVNFTFTVNETAPSALYILRARAKGVGLQTIYYSREITLLIGSNGIPLFISVSPKTLSVKQDEWGNAIVNIIRSDGVIEDINLSVESSYQGITTYFEPDELDPNENQSALYVGVDGYVAAGTYPIIIRGTAGNFIAQDTLVLNVQSGSGDAKWVLADSGNWRLNAVTYGSVGGAAPGLVAVGSNGIIIRANTPILGEYEAVESGTTQILNDADIDFASRDYYACGNGGALIHSNDGGRTWSEVSEISTQSNLNGVSVYSNNSVITVVGGDGEIFWWNPDAGWRRKTNLHQQYYLWDVGHWAISSALVVGDSSLGSGFSYILKTTDAGVTWERLLVGAPRSYMAIACPYPEVAIVVGANGSIQKTTDGGESWQPRTSGTTLDLYDIHFYPASTLIGCIVGGNNLGESIILLTTDGGDTWQQETSEGSGNLFGVFIEGNGQLGTAVGEDRILERRGNF